MLRAACAALAAVFHIAGAGDALAFGDTCRKDVAAKGTVQSSMSSARSAAIAAWEAQTARVHGRRFANWWYSGDRSIDCSWDRTGTRIRCTAVALPCAPRR